MAAILAVAAFLSWPEPVNTARERPYRDYDVCLLTGELGLATSSAQKAWSALGAVSKKAEVRAFYLEVRGEQTPEHASQYVSTLVAQRCRILVTTGGKEAVGATLAKSRYPSVFFIDAGADVDPAALEAQILPLIPPA